MHTWPRLLSVLLLFIQCLLLLPFCVGFFVWSLFCGVVSFLFWDHFAEEERAGYFTLIVLWLPVFVSLPSDAVGWVSEIVVFPGHTHLLSQCPSSVYW